MPFSPDTSVADVMSPQSVYSDRQSAGANLTLQDDQIDMEQLLQLASQDPQLFNDLFAGP